MPTLSQIKKLSLPAIKNFFVNGPLWVHKVSAFLIGLCFLFIFQPYAFSLLYFPLFILTFQIFRTTLQHSKKHTFKIGWLFGLGYFVGGLHWIAYALHVDIGRFWWLIPFAVLGIPGIMALFFAMTFLLTRSLNQNSGVIQIFCFITLWSLMEWLRGHVIFGGLPWLNLGEIEFFPVIHGCNVPLQALKVYGVYGVGFVWLMLGSAIYLGYVYKKKILGMLISLLGIVLLYGPFAYDFLIRKDDFKFRYHQHFTITLVQPSIAQIDKWNLDLFHQHLDHMMQLSHQSVVDQPRLIIWPEASVPYAIESNTPLTRYMASILRPGDYLIFGAPYMIKDQHDSITKAYNSTHILDHTGIIQARYDKYHLVPFGEYVPLRKYIPAFINKISPGNLDYSPGPGLQPLQVNKFPAFNTLICFEAIFPGAVRDHRTQTQAPAWLLNLTNDGWYLNSAGPYQHLQIARLRAIEEGLPLVRCVYQGISAVFDPYGREIIRIPYNHPQAINFKLPKPLPYTTLYSKYGDFIYFLMILYFLLGIVGYKYNVSLRQKKE